MILETKKYSFESKYRKHYVISNVIFCLTFIVVPAKFCLIFLFNFIYLFITLCPYHGTVHTTERGPKLIVPLEEVTDHNTGISLLLSTSVWVLLSPPIERRETRPTA